jgi:hypothetical protein
MNSEHKSIGEAEKNRGFKRDSFLLNIKKGKESGYDLSRRNI